MSETHRRMIHTKKMSSKVNYIIQILPEELNYQNPSTHGKGQCLTSKENTGSAIKTLTLKIKKIPKVKKKNNPKSISEKKKLQAQKKDLLIVEESEDPILYKDVENEKPFVVQNGKDYSENKFQKNFFSSTRGYI